MATHTVVLTDAEDLAMKHIAADVDAWVQTAAHERARIAADEIAKYAVQRCLDKSMPIPPSRDEIVQLAYDQGWIKTAAQREEERLLAEQAAAQ